MSSLVNMDQEEYGFFVGNSLMFSNTVLKLATVEFDCIRFTRLSFLDELFSIPAEQAAQCRVLIIGESHADALHSRFSALHDHFRHAQIGLAYRNVEIAKNFIKEINHLEDPKAIGFLPMGLDVDLWMAIMRLLVFGESFLPHELIDSNEAAASDPAPAGQQKATPADTGLAALTERELQVLSSVSEGKQNKIIAAEMKLSEHTIKLHLHKIISKLGVNNRTEATIRFLAEHGAANRHAR